MTKRGLIPGLIFLLICAISRPVLGAQSRIMGRGKIQNFQTQLGDPERKVMIFGTNAVALPNGLTEVTQLRAETFRGKTNRPEFIIQSPLCYLDKATETAFSERELKIKSMDGSFSLSGVGFRWDPKSKRLMITNDVEAQFDRALLKLESTNPPAVRAPKRLITVHSRSLDYATNYALFSHSVEVLEPEGKLASELLKLDLSEGGQVSRIEAGGGVSIQYANTHAKGEGATYDVDEDLFTLTNRTTWSIGDRSGSSEFLALRRERNELTAREHVQLTLPISSLAISNAPAGRTNAPSLMRIEAAEFHYSTNRAAFGGGVLASETGGQLRAEKLEVNFSTNQNQITHATALGKVQFNRGDREASGERATYDLLQQRIALAGSDRPTEWKVGDRRGSSDFLELRTAGDEFEARGHVKMSLPIQASMLPSFGGTNQAVGTNGSQTLQLEAGKFIRKGDSSIFEDKVLARTAQGTIAAESALLTTGSSNQVTRVLAKTHVVVHQKDRVATGELAEYDAQTGLLQLSGDPAIIDPQATVRAERFILDLGTGGFRTQGKYRIELHRAPAKP